MRAGFCQQFLATDRVEVADHRFQGDIRAQPPRNVNTGLDAAVSDAGVPAVNGDFGLRVDRFKQGAHMGLDDAASWSGACPESVGSPRLDPHMFRIEANDQRIAVCGIGVSHP